LLLFALRSLTETPLNPELLPHSHQLSAPPSSSATTRPETIMQSKPAVPCPSAPFRSWSSAPLPQRAALSSSSRPVRRSSERVRGGGAVNGYRVGRGERLSVRVGLGGLVVQLRL
jgi:hypothetical protein